MTVSSGGATAWHTESVVDALLVQAVSDQQQLSCLLRLHWLALDKVMRQLALGIVFKQASEGLLHVGHHLDSLNKKSGQGR